MPTEKRQRQKEGRQRRLEAQRKANRRRQNVRRGVTVLVIAAIVSFSAYKIFGKSSSPAPTNPLVALQTTANATAVAAGCPTAPATAAHPANTLHWTHQPALTINTHKHYFATFVTTAGRFKVQLDAATAPVNVNNFVFLADHGYYKCVTFHRVVPGFMDQSGDPTSSGKGGPGYSVKPNEYPKTSAGGTAHDYYTPGIVAMANSGPGTNGAQFFIMAKSSSLPPNYTIIGHVVSGQPIVDAINVVGSPDLANGKFQIPKVIERILSVTITDS